MAIEIRELDNSDYPSIEEFVLVCTTAETIVGGFVFRASREVVEAFLFRFGDVRRFDDAEIRGIWNSFRELHGDCKECDGTSFDPMRDDPEGRCGGCFIATF